MTTLTRATIAELVELHDLLNGISTTVDEWMQAFDNNEKILRRTLIAEIQYHNKKQNNYDLLYWNAKKITTKQLVELDNLLNGENNTLAEWIDAIDNEDELRETLKFKAKPKLKDMMETVTTMTQYIGSRKVEIYHHLNHYRDMMKVRNTKTTNLNSNINADLRI